MVINRVNFVRWNRDKKQPLKCFNFTTDLSEQGKKGPKAALYNKGESLFPLTELEASKYRENIIFSTGFREI